MENKLTLILLVVLLLHMLVDVYLIGPHDQSILPSILELKVNLQTNIKKIEYVKKIVPYRETAKVLDQVYRFWARWWQHPADRLL